MYGVADYYALGFFAGLPIGYYMFDAISVKKLVALNALALFTGLAIGRVANIAGLEDILLMGFTLAGADAGSWLARLNKHK